MPVVNIPCKFDSTKWKTGVQDFCDRMRLSRDQYGFMQYDIPDLEEVYISSAKLFVYMRDTGKNLKVTPTLFNVDYALNGAALGTYDSFIRNGMVNESEDTHLANSDISYMNWISFDITDLLIGYIGRKNYTIGMMTEVTGQSFNLVTLSSITDGSPSYIQLSYEFSVPFKPTPIYPVGEAISNTGNITFSWKYNSSGSSKQKKFDLQWKMQANTTWNTVSQETDSTSYTMNASVMNNGIVEWRVRSYNKGNMVSEWAESQFVVIGRPANPVISGVKNDAITEITWTANKAEESAARIKIKRDGWVIYDSRIVPGGIEDSHKPNIMLSDGNYIAYLQISNMYDMWSNEITYPFTIGNEKPKINEFSVFNCGDFVKLTFDGTDGSEFFVFRAEDWGDFIPIARVNAIGYDDFAVKAGKRYRYFVRCYKRGYVDSTIKDVTIKYKGYILSCVENMEQRINLIHHDSEYHIPLEKRTKMSNSLILYVGRKRPVKESGEHVSESISISAYVDKKGEKTLEQIYKTNGVYCIRSEDFVMFCEISELGASMRFFNRGYLMNMTFDSVDYEEKVRFNE